MLYIWSMILRFPIGIRDIPDDWNRHSPRGTIFSYFKKIKHCKLASLMQRSFAPYTPTTVTSTLGDVDDTGITTFAILPEGVSV